MCQQSLPAPSPSAYLSKSTPSCSERFTTAFKIALQAFIPIIPNLSIILSCSHQLINLDQSHHRLLICIILNIIISSSLFACFLKRSLGVYRNKYLMALSFASLILNYELYWINQNYTMLAVLYIQNLWTIPFYTHFLDQVIHLILSTIYFGLMHLRIDSYSVPAAILVCGMFISFFLFIITQKKSPSNIDLLHGQISSLFLNKKSSSSLILNGSLEPIFMSQSLSEFFELNQESSSQLVKDILLQITDVSCAEDLLNIIAQENLPMYLTDNKENLSREDQNKLKQFGSLKSLINKTQGGSLESILRLFFAFPQTFQKFNIGWESPSSAPKLYSTFAYYHTKKLSLNLSYLKNPQDSSPMILIQFSPAGAEFESTPSNLSMVDIASIIHEIRTPLNGITFLIQETMNLPQIPEEIKQDLLKPSLESARRLWYIVNDILDFAQILDGKLKLVFESFDLASVLKQPIQILEALGRAKGLKVILEVDSALPTMITTDQNRLVQVVYNLMGNALKFTKEGYVKLKVTPADKKAKFIDFSVEDTGYGIKAEDISKLFQTFQKLDNWNDNKTGSGLGLCISNALAKALGRGLSVRSEYQKGSTFMFSIENIKASSPESILSLGEISASTNAFSHSRTMSLGSPAGQIPSCLQSRKNEKSQTMDLRKKSSIHTIMEENAQENIRASIKSLTEGNMPESPPKKSMNKIGPDVTVTSLDQLCTKERDNIMAPVGMSGPLPTSLKRNESNEVQHADNIYSTNQTVYCDFNYPSSSTQLSLQRPSLQFEKRIPRSIQTLHTFGQPKIEEVEGGEEEEIASPGTPVNRFNKSSTHVPLLINNRPVNNWVEPLITCSCPRILAVDDEPLNILILKFLVKELNLNGKYFNNGDALIEYLVDCSPDEYCSCGGPLFVLMDCYMPEKDGFALTKELRALMDAEKIPRTFIIACTADESEHMKDKIYKSGMNDFVKKPVSKATLEGLIKKYM